jgi:hypothetical protein
MPMIRRLHRRLAWIALFAMLAMALAPTVSHALAAEQAPWSAVCSAMGSTPSAPMADPTQAPIQAHLDHCPFCALQGATPALPSAPTPWLPGELSQPMPALYWRAPHPLFAWCAAQPRAPPVLS